MNDLGLLPSWYWLLMGALLGGCLASFLGVVLERVPVRAGIGGRSHCACGRQLSAGENIPIVGWLRIGGRARCCGTRLPATYLISEVLGAAGLGALGWVFGPAGIGAGAALGVSGVTLLALGRRRRNPLPGRADDGR